jgi:hypothetical protein
MTENAEMELAGPELLVPYDDPHRETLEAEKSLWRAVIVWTLVAIPICIVIWTLLIILAVGTKDPEWGAWIGIGIIVGVRRCVLRRLGGVHREVAPPGHRRQAPLARALSQAPPLRSARSVRCCGLQSNVPAFVGCTRRNLPAHLEQT